VNIAYVVHRYGVEVLGGAEQACRSLAERLAAGGWDVDVFTTCARDGTDWEDQYPPGESVVNGVRIHRFQSVAGRAPDFEAFSESVLPQAANASMAVAERWIDLQGPICPAAIDAAAASDPDIAVFYPYLYYPTVRGVRRLEDRAVMHPAAHDELPLRLPVFRDVFARCRGFVFQTESERALVEGRFPEAAAIPQVLVGLGIESGQGDPDRFRETFGLGDRPFVLCLGRVDEFKGSLMLADYFAAYKERHPGPLALVFVGPVVDHPPQSADVVVTGPVDESLKWGALGAAELLVSPSPLESFSIVLMEAWDAGIPVLVNAACGPTQEHCERSNGGLWFDGYATFEAALDRLLGDPELRTTLAAAGRTYVERQFRWDAVLSRYQRFLERVRARRH
jgi:glycosyltransferase involved in cell wall biosynthesis